MAVFSAAEALRLLDVKDSVLRYWEEEIPLIQPRRGANGRKEYSERDLALLLRVKHLVQEKKHTVEGAREELLRELSGDGQDGRAALNEIRTELLRLYLSLNPPRK